MHVVALEGAGDPSGLSSLLQRQLRDGDLLARIDRLRFVILQKNVSGPADAEACARRLSGLNAPTPFHVRTALPQYRGGAAGQRPPTACAKRSRRRARMAPKRGVKAKPFGAFFRG